MALHGMRGLYELKGHIDSRDSVSGEASETDFIVCLLHPFQRNHHHSPLRHPRGRKFAKVTSNAEQTLTSLLP